MDYVRNLTISISLLTMLVSSSPLQGGLLPQIVPAPETSTGVKRDAWIYPDAAGVADALHKYSNIYAAKTEYLRVGEDGELEQLDQSEDYINGFSAANVALLKERSREQYITVAGQMSGTEIAMQKPDTIPKMVELAEKTGFNIELDWEEYGQWTTGYYQTYKTFLRQLDAELDQRGLKLMVDGPPIFSSGSQGWYQWKYEEIAPLVDSTVMMIYDNQYDEGVGTSIAPKLWSQQCLQWLKNKAGDKAIAGIAAYGYSGDKRTGRIAVNTSDQIKRQAGTATFTRNADGERTAWKGDTFYAYADEQTLQTRIDQVEQMGVGRLSVWSLGRNPWL